MQGKEYKWFEINTSRDVKFLHSTTLDFVFENSGNNQNNGRETAILNHLISKSAQFKSDCEMCKNRCSELLIEILDSNGGFYASFQYNPKNNIFTKTIP